MLFISPQKLFSFSRYLSFCLEFLVMYQKGLIKKIKVNFKFYDVAASLTNNCNTHIAQYLEMSDFVSCICSNDLLDINRSVVESYCSTGFSCAVLTLSKSIFFELLVLIPLVLHLIRSVSAEVSLNSISRIRFKSLREKCPDTELHFSRICTEYGDIRSIQNTGQKKLRIWTIFTQ